LALVIFFKWQNEKNIKAKDDVKCQQCNTVSQTEHATRTRHARWTLPQ